MKLSKRAKRGIAIFNAVATRPSNFLYRLSQTKMDELKEKLNGLIRTGREGNVSAPSPDATGGTPHAEPSGEVQSSVHDVHANDIGGAPATSEIAPTIAPEAGRNVSERNV